MAKSNEPIVWSLFSAGGVLTALVIPVLVVLLGFAAPLGWIELRFEHVEALLGHWLTGVFLVALVCLTLFHWAHRFRFTLYDGLQIKHLNKLIVLVSYGAVLVGTIAAGVLVWQLP